MALNTEFLVKMPMSQKLLILAAIILLLFLGYWLLIDTKLTQELKKQNETLSGRRQELSKLETVEKDKEKLDRELKEKERKLEKAKEKLPTETEMERLLLDINDLGKKNGVEYKTFKPLTEKKQGNLYYEVPISLKFSGSYLYTMNFFYEVATLPRIVNFSGVSITARSSKSKVTDVEVNCTATTYKFAGN